MRVFRVAARCARLIQARSDLAASSRVRWSGRPDEVVAFRASTNAAHTRSTFSAARPARYSPKSGSRGPAPSRPASDSPVGGAAPTRTSGPAAAGSRTSASTSAGAVPVRARYPRKPVPNSGNEVPSGFVEPVVTGVPRWPEVAGRTSVEWSESGELRPVARLALPPRVPGREAMIDTHEDDAEPEISYLQRVNLTVVSTDEFGAQTGCSLANPPKELVCRASRRSAG